MLHYRIPATQKIAERGYMCGFEPCLVTGGPLRWARPFRCQLVRLFKFRLPALAPISAHDYCSAVYPESMPGRQVAPNSLGELASSGHDSMSMEQAQNVGILAAEVYFPSTYVGYF